MHPTSVRVPWCRMLWSSYSFKAGYCTIQIKQRQMIKISPSLPSSLVPREKMPFHHVTAGLLYKGNYLNRSLSAGSDSEQLANISVEELDGEPRPCDFPKRAGNGERLVFTFSVALSCNNQRYSPREARGKRQVRSEMAQQIRDKEKVPNQSYVESCRLVLASDFVLLPRNKAAFWKSKASFYGQNFAREKVRLISFYKDVSSPSWEPAELNLSS